MNTIKIMSRNIFMCASDLAVITGHNPYKDKSEIILKYWKKHFKVDYIETKQYMKKNNINEKIKNMNVLKGYQKRTILT